MHATLTGFKNSPSLSPGTIILVEDRIIIGRGSKVKRGKHRPTVKKGENLYILAFEGEQSTISRKHVVLVWNKEAKKYRIVNKATRSPTIINKQRLPSGEAAWLNNKDILKLGDDVVFLVTYL